MKEICHKGLVELIGKYGQSPIEATYLNKCKIYSVEPDKAQNSLKKLLDHTINARQLTIFHLRRAITLYREGNIDWVKELGYSYHFIVDWGTPHHSPLSKSNPVIWRTFLNTLLGGILGYATTSEKKKGEQQKRSIQGAVSSAVSTLGTELPNLILQHGEFEELCDQYWRELELDIINRFINRETRYRPPIQNDQVFVKFNRLMDYLRQECNSLPKDWIHTCNPAEYVQYMVKIANVLDYATQIVLR